MPLSDGAALLRARGYQHADTGFWYDRAARKVFAVDYVWRRDLAALEADLAEDTQGRLRVYAIWPLVPEAQLELERIFWEDFSSGGGAGG